MGKYDINYSSGTYNDNLSIMLLPFEFRKTKLTALLFCINAPIRRMMSEFRVWMTDKNYRMQHTGQVKVLQHVLREKMLNNTITVVDSINYQETYLSADSTLVNYQIYTPAGSVGDQLLVGTRDTFREFGHFVVNVPISFTVEQIKHVSQIVDTYKICGKFYIIQKTI